jgi:hypothetical protein
MIDLGTPITPFSAFMAMVLGAITGSALAVIIVHVAFQ